MTEDIPFRLISWLLASSDVSSNGSDCSQLPLLNPTTFDNNIDEELGESSSCIYFI